MLSEESRREAGRVVMPSARQTRGRTRTKSGAVRGARSRLTKSEAVYRSGSPVVQEAHSSDNIPEGAVLMAPAPHPGWQASQLGFHTDNRHFLKRMCGPKHCGLLLIFIWTLLLLTYFLKFGLSNSVAQHKYVLWNNENDDGQALAKETMIEVLVNFFFPTTCIPKENQKLKPCSGGQALNLSECLKYKCCYSDTSYFGCFTPLNDVPAQMFRMFALGVSSMIILGFLPIYCCSLCRRSRWARSLRRKVSRISKGWKKQRNKQKQNTEKSGALTEDEAEQESQALLLR